MNRILYKTLQKAAKKGKTLSIEKAGASVGLDPSVLGELLLLQKQLREISLFESSLSRPLLSAVVVGEDGEPVEEFVKMVEEFGLDLSEQIKRTFEYWKEEEK